MGPKGGYRRYLGARYHLLILSLVSYFLGQYSLTTEAYQSDQHYAGVKISGFIDPNTGYLYRVTSYNATTMTTDMKYRSIIRVTRERPRLPNEIGPMEVPETIQSLKYHETLVDFDLDCLPTHCYLVTVTSRSRKNVKLFTWHRTQFNSVAVRDSFSRPSAVKIFRILSGFYVAIAQEQLHLSPYKMALEWDEPPRFIGCTILKFFQGREKDIRYHQFIRLPFNPNYVVHLVSMNANNFTGQALKNHYLIFSMLPNWADSTAGPIGSYIWSHLNDHFWLHKLPRDVEFTHGTSTNQLPGGTQLGILNQTQPDRVNPIEACFYQLQRLLADRDFHARKLIESSSTVWRAHQSQAGIAANQLTNISAQVIVLGNVDVVGSLIESPQVSLIAGRERSLLPSDNEVAKLVKSHSPARVENKFKTAWAKLNYIRQKLSRAVIGNGPAIMGGSQNQYLFNHQVRFFGNVLADEIIFGDVANSNVRINGLPFKQLEHELVSLNGPQDIATKVIFNGRVFADVLEIHGSINEHFHLKDAVDITSRSVQIIDASQRTNTGGPSIEFSSLSASNVILTHNATVNNIRLDDFITRDNRTQQVFGRKLFKRLYMRKLDLANPSVRLNDLNLSRLSANALHLRPDPFARPYQLIGGAPVTFSKSVQAKRLIIDGVINQHINLTSLIQDSVKMNDPSLQQISGQKNFKEVLKINRLTCESLLNGLEVSQIFNLNPRPPTSEQQHSYATNSSHLIIDPPITGEFKILAPVTVYGKLNAGLVNGIDLVQRVVQRSPSPSTSGPPQIIRGRKIFLKPLRVIDSFQLLDQQQLARIYGNSTGLPYPLVNGLDLRLVEKGLAMQLQQPPLVYIDNLDIEGNLNLANELGRNGTQRVTFGNFPNCPLDLIRRRLVLASQDQVIETPIRVNVLRAHSIMIREPGTLNGYRFPADFVFRTALSDTSPAIEPVYGKKFFEHLVIAPVARPLLAGQYPANLIRDSREPNIVVDRGITINQINYPVLQTYIEQERKRNSTGERLLNTLNVYGSLYSKRINGYSWPDDILLKSMSSTRGQPSSPYLHKRIYSPLVFTESSGLHVLNQLVLRGPIQLNGRVNGVNLTEFARRSATYGDKDLYSARRPLRNKLFLGGLTVKGEIRTQGLIDGVNFDDMANRVVSIGSSGTQVQVMSPKMFMSDMTFNSPVSINYLNDLPIDQYLRRIRFESDGITIKIPHKKTITGALRINKNLYVSGLINGINFPELKARAISLASTKDELVFNKTLTVEGDVYMDNLWIDEKNGIIDGIKLTNLLPLRKVGKSELVLNEPRVSRNSTPFGRDLHVDGLFLECQISCDLQTVTPYDPRMYFSNQSWSSYRPTPANQIVYPTHSVLSYTSRPSMGTGEARSMAPTRTTPPYGLSSSYQPPLKMVPPSDPHSHGHLVLNSHQYPQIRREQLHNLMDRKPISIHYEQPSMVQSMKRSLAPAVDSGPVDERLERLRRHMVSSNLFRPVAHGRFVAGFIEAMNNDLSDYETIERYHIHYDNVAPPKSYLQLDQFDFPFRPTIYHLSVGVATSQTGQNVTSVFSSLGGSNFHELSVLPVQFPNSAMFLMIPDVHAMFLLISQDYSVKSGMCATSEIILGKLLERNYNKQQQLYESANRVESGIHVFLFHALENSSSLESAYFDLYQTLDLPGIDGFDKFTYNGSTYVLAISKSTGRIYVLLLRGYTGFQLVSHIDAPMVEYVSVMQTKERRPVLVIRQTTGLHRIMEAVVI